MVALKPEFQSLSEPEVKAALNSINPISMEVGRLYQLYIEKFHHAPADVQEARPRWPIQAVAMQRAIAYLSAAMEME